MRSRISIYLRVGPKAGPFRPCRVAAPDRRASWSRRPLLDPPLVLLALQDVPHENPRRHHVVRIDLAGLDQVLYFGDRHARGSGHDRVEVAPRLAVDQVAVAVPFPRPDEREVGVERRLEDVWPAVDDPRFL